MPPAVARDAPPLHRPRILRSFIGRNSFENSSLAPWMRAERAALYTSSGSRCCASGRRPIVDRAGALNWARLRRDAVGESAVLDGGRRRRARGALRANLAPRPP